MPSIKLTDQLGLDLEAQPAPTSALLKYFQELPLLHLDSLDLSKVGGLTLDQPAIRMLATGVSLAEPVDIGADAALKVGAGAKARIRIGPDASELPGHDDDFAIPQNTCYVSFEIQATV